MFKKITNHAKKIAIRLILMTLSVFCFIAFKLLQKDPQFGRGYIFLTCFFFLAGLLLFMIAFKRDLK